MVPSRRSKSASDPRQGSRFSGGKYASAPLVLLLGCALSAPTALFPQHPGLQLRGVVEIGVAHGESSYELGRIADLATDRRGLVYVLDQLNSEVRVYAPDGRFLNRIGRAGQGPGEFSLPTALVVAGEDLYVLDQRNRRILQFAIEDSVAVYRRAAALPFPASDLCVLNGEIYLFGYYRGAILHAFSMTAGVRRSFGTSFAEKPSRLLHATTNAGFILCIAQPPTLILLPYIWPRLDAYSPDGELLWRTTLPGYREQKIQINLDGSVTYKWNETAAFHLGAGLHFLAPASIIVQLGLLRRGATSPDAFSSITTQFFSVEDGKFLGSTDEVPRLGGVRPGFAYGVVNDPVPRITVYRLEVRWR